MPRDEHCDGDHHSADGERGQQALVASQCLSNDMLGAQSEDIAERSEQDGPHG